MINATDILIYQSSDSWKYKKSILKIINETQSNVYNKSFIFVCY